MSQSSGRVLPGGELRRLPRRSTLAVRPASALAQQQHGRPQRRRCSGSYAHAPARPAIRRRTALCASCFDRSRRPRRLGALRRRSRSACAAPDDGRGRRRNLSAPRMATSCCASPRTAASSFTPARCAPAPPPRKRGASRRWRRKRSRSRKCSDASAHLQTQARRSVGQPVMFTVPAQMSGRLPQALSLDAAERAAEGLAAAPMTNVRRVIIDIGRQPARRACRAISCSSRSRRNSAMRAAPPRAPSATSSCGSVAGPRAISACCRNVALSCLRSSSERFGCPRTLPQSAFQATAAARAGTGWSPSQLRKRHRHRWFALRRAGVTSADARLQRRVVRVHMSAKRALDCVYSCAQ